MESHHSHVTIQPCMFPPNSLRDQRTEVMSFQINPLAITTKRKKARNFILLRQRCSDCSIIIPNVTLIRNSNILSIWKKKKKKKHNNFIYGHRNKNNTSNIYEMFQKTKLINTKHKKTFIKYNFSPFTVW